MDIKKREDEKLLDYYKRITDNRKEYDLDYAEWSELLIGEAKYSSENSRKAYYILKVVLENLYNEEIENLPKSKIEEIKDIIGELDVKKIEIRNKTNKLNKIKRDFVRSYEIANDIKDCLRENSNFPKFDNNRIEVYSDNKLIVHCGDWHIGYVINDYKGNYYNYEIAKKRLSKLKQEVANTCSLYNINDIVLVHCGDHIENCYMRENQGYECEFDLSHQIVYASKILFSFANELTQINDGVNVDIPSVGGNHNRVNKSKEANIEGDNANVIICENIETYIELSGNKRLRLLKTDYKDDTSIFNINGLNVKIMHGDNRPHDTKKVFDSEQSMDNEKYDLILMGHYHNFNVKSQNNGGYVVTCGCLFGYNPYSVKKMACNTNASQNLIVVGNKEIISIKDVNLQIV